MNRNTVGTPEPRTVANRMPGVRVSKTESPAPEIQKIPRADCVGDSIFPGRARRGFVCCSVVPRTGCRARCRTRGRTGRTRTVMMRRGSPARRRRRRTTSAPAPGVAVPIPAAGIDDLNSVVIPVFVSSGSDHHRGRSRSDHHRSRSNHHGSRGRSDHHRGRLNDRADQIHDIGRQADTARTAMMVMIRRRSSEQNIRCREQTSGGDSGDQE